MIIANPIYDVVFKRLMENDRVAKFFISTLLGQKVESLELKPQEFTYTEELIGVASEKDRELEEQKRLIEELKKKLEDE